MSPGAMDGITAAAAIAEERIAPVVMLTAFSQRELVERARDAGAMAYVVKPFDASDVVPAIEIAIGRFAEIRAVEAEVSAEALSKREGEILQLVADGLSNREIAEQLFLSRYTVESHVKHIYRKLAVSSRTMAVQKARSQGVVE